MIPTPKTIAARLGVSIDTARAVRRAMETHSAPFASETLERIGAILAAGGLEHYGPEIIFPGDGPRSPSIDYLNTGETYAPTVLYLDGVTSGGRATGAGRWAVGSWGAIVERGNYQ